MAKEKPIKTLLINDPEYLQKTFYSQYKPEHWFYRFELLRRCHENDATSTTLFENWKDEYCQEDLKKMLRIEMHFLYFQMVETLFELIFAISSHDSRELWLALSFSGNHQTGYHSDTYGKISAYAKDELNDPDFNKN